MRAGGGLPPHFPPPHGHPSPRAPRGARHASRAGVPAPSVPPSAALALSSATAVASALGWPLVKGFLVFELTSSEVEVSAGLSALREIEPGSSFVAFRHWWNCHPGGPWVDLTPPLVAPAALDGRSLLPLLRAPCALAMIVGMNLMHLVEYLKCLLAPDRAGGPTCSWRSMRSKPCTDYL